MHDICLFPQPAHVRQLPGLYAGDPERPAFRRDDSLPPEGYRLVIDEDITVYHADAAGAFYAGQTLRQLRAQPAGLPRCEITDAPGLRIRGFLLDISRGRVPTPETLCRLVDVMAQLKLNHLQLYIEGFSFQYPSYARYVEADSSLSPDELRAFDAYCRERFVTLVPCQNSLGHMGAWLAQPEFAPLAEAPGGFALQGFTLPPTTLDVRDPGSLALVRRLTDELGACFDTRLFNVCLDEPFELGRGNNRATWEAEGPERLYGDYMDALYAHLKATGRRMLLWGDVLAAHPGLYERMPRDALILEWGYEAEHPFAQRAADIAAQGLDFCVCPGTSAWSAFLPMMDDAFANILSAARAAYAHGAEGLILTDWGDGGHLPSPGSCLLPLSLAASLAWQPEPPETAQLTAFVNRAFFPGEGDLAGAWLRLGQYTRCENARLPCRSYTHTAFSLGEPTQQALEARLGLYRMIMRQLVTPEVLPFYRQSLDGLPQPDFGALTALLAQVGSMLPSTDRPSTARAELLSTLDNVRLGVLCLRQALGDGEHGPELRALADKAGREHSRLWHTVSKPGGLEITLSQFERLAGLGAGSPNPSLL